MTRAIKMINRQNGILKHVGGGYGKVSRVLNTVFNITLALFLILCALPLFVTIFVLLRLQENGPALYRGVRLGRNKEPFTMYKFRTLVPNAERLIGAELLTTKHGLITPMGKYLRDTRLDELPQLFNIILGDMDFLGPRPERPLIYEKFCKHIRGYEKRFSVKPGLIGFSQLFTPHSAPKRMRTLIDNALIEKKQKFLWDTFFVLFTILIVVNAILRKSILYFWKNVVLKKMFHKFSEKRELERVSQKHTKIYVAPKGKKKKAYENGMELIDINEDAFLMYSTRELDSNKVTVKLEKEFSGIRGKGKKLKSARCSGEIFKKAEINERDFKYSYVIRYEPDSSFNSYLIHQYFLGESMAH